MRASKHIAVANNCGAEGTVPKDFDPAATPVGYANGGFTLLHLAAREGELEAARMLLDDGRSVLGAN
jgi:hypothetical protein